MAIDNKTLKISFEGDTTSLDSALRELQKELNGTDASLSKVVTKYDKAGNAVSRFIEVAGKNISTLNNLKESLKSSVTSSTITESGNVDKLLEAQQKLLNARAEKRLKQEEAEAKLIGDLQARLAAEKIAQENRQLAERAAESKKYFAEQKQLIEKHWNANKVITQNGADAEKGIIARAAAEELKIKQDYANKVAEIERQIAAGAITQGKGKFQLGAINAQTSGQLQGLFSQTASAVQATKAPTIDWSERKALLEKELAYEAAKSASFFNAERAKAAQYARDKLEIEQAYASKRRTIEEQVRSGALSISNANKQHTAALNEYGNAIRKLPDLKEHIAQHRSLIGVIAQSTAVYRIFSSMWNTLWNGVFSIPKVGVQLEATIASLTSTLGSADLAASAIGAINTEARRTGLSINSLRESFKNFQASTSLAGASLNDTWKMFTNINTVALGLHLTVDQTTHVFNALAQIFNKSKVQSEELVKQLGNLLPGAFAAFAKSMSIAPEELSKRMKKGIVFAQDTMLGFTNFMETTFRQAAAVAAVGFNAELGRMNNSFTLLGEAIYRQTSGPMITFMKALSKITDFTAEGIKGNNALGTVLKDLGNIILSLVVGSVVTATAKFLSLQKVITATGIEFSRLNKVMDFLRNPTIIVAGITLIAKSLYDAKNATEDAARSTMDWLDSIARAKKEASLAADFGLSPNDAATVVESSKRIQQEFDNIKKARENISKYKAVGGDSTFDVISKAIYGPLIAQEENVIRQSEVNIKRLKGVQKEAYDTASLQQDIKKKTEMEERLTVLTENNAKARVAALRAEGKNSEAELQAALDMYQPLLDKAKAQQQAILAAQEKAGGPLGEEATRTLKILSEDIKNYETIIARAGKNTSLKESAKTTREAFKLNSDEIKIASNEIALKLKELENSYGQNNISLQKYVADKRQILQEDYQREVSLLAKRRDIALANKNVGEAQHITNQIEQAAIQNKTKLAEVENEQVTKTNELLDATERLNAEYVKAKTGVDTTAEQKYDKLLKNINSLPEEKRLVVKGQVEELNAINTALNRTRGLNEQINQINSTASEKIQTINALKNVGAMSEIRSAMEINNILEEQIALIEEKISVKEKELALAPSSLELDKEVESLKKQKAALEQLKQTAETTGNVLTQKIGGAFESSFASLLSGTSSGKQAFSDFVNSVIQDINRMVASELRSSILQPLLQKGIGLAVGALGSYFGGGVDAFGANASGRIVSSAFQANGGVNTGMGIGNGIVLDRATYFPTASPVMMAMGGVVAGEAGKEAVLPLAKTSNGKLGVQTTGGANGSGITIENMSVVVQERKDESSDEQAGRIAQTMREQLLTLIDGRITNSVRSGGLLNQTRVQTAFSN